MIYQTISIVISLLKCSNIIAIFACFLVTCYSSAFGNHLGLGWLSPFSSLQGIVQVNLPMATIENRDGGVLVTIKRSPLFEKLYRGDTQNDTQNDTQKITLRQTEILNLMRQDIHVSASVLSEKLNVSLATIRRDLRRLNKEKLLFMSAQARMVIGRC